jgi:glycosyltransferase involved in cell wall biosynthesis
MGMGGVLRPIKFAKYFKEFDWQPIIITDTPRNYYAKDDFLMNELRDSDTRIYRTRLRGRKNILNDNKLKRLPNEGTRQIFRNLSQILHIPDSKKKWQKRAIMLASNILDNEDISIIYTTAPPFRDFNIGVELKKKYNIPLVVDYRDSWLDSPSRFFLTPMHRFANMKMEAEVLRVADVVLTINRRIKEKIIGQYPKIKQNDITIMPHCYDKEDFEQFNTQLPRTSKMRFTHAGSFFNNDTPKYFLEALSIVFRRKPELKKKIEACFIGSLTKENINRIKEFNLFDTIYAPGYVNHKESIKYMLASDVLWFMIGKGQGDELVTPAKLSEYIGAEKPIIACIPDGAAKLMLKNYNAVKICGPDKPEDIAQFIIEYYELFQKNNLPVPNQEMIEKYDIKNIAHQLVRSFEFLIDIAPQTTIKEHLKAG